MTATASEGDDRIIRESGIDARIALIVQPVLRGIGFRLVRVHLSGQNGLTLQIMAERPETGQLNIDDCARHCRGGSLTLFVLIRSKRPIISKSLRPASTGRWCANRISSPGPVIW